jgi:hypothetical protein
MAGQPFLALYVSAALYPPNLLLVGILPPARALEALALFHFTVSGLFTWLFTRRLGLAPAARLAAAVGYMLAPVQVFGIYMVQCLATQAWLPAILWALHGLLAEARRRWAVALAICFALAFLAGYAVGIYYILLLSLAYGIFGLFVVARTGTRLRVVAQAALAGVLALGLVAPQLLPTLELAERSVRTLDGFTYAGATYGSIKPAILLRGIAGSMGLEPGLSERAVTLPMLTIPLVLAGALARRLRAHWLFAVCAAAVAGLFTLGARSPVHAFFYALPLGKSFRGPWQMLFVYQFLAVVLAGIGIQAVLERLRGARPGGRLSWTVAAGLAVLVIGDLYARTELAVPPPAIVAPDAGGPAGLIEFLRRSPGRERVFIQALGGRILHKIGMMNRLFALPDYESNMPLVYQQFLTGGSVAMWQGSLNIVGHPRALRLSRPRARSLDLMSVRYYAMPHPSPPGYSETLEGFAGSRVARGHGYELFERRDALPRAYVVGRVLHEPTTEAALAHVQRGTFRPWEEAVVTATPGAGTPHLAARSGNGHVGHARIVTYEPETLEITASCERSCLLVLTDLHFPGWQASVDGRAVEIHETNAVFRGVFLETGTHRVTYRYAPASFRNGLWLLLCALPAGGLGLLAIRRRATAARPTGA